MRMLLEKIVNKKGTGEYEIIDLIRDLNYVDTWMPKKNYQVPLYHTSKGEFSYPLTLEGVKSALEPHGFMSLDTINVVNLRNIDYVRENSYGLTAYFSDGSTANVARVHRKTIQHLIKKDHS